MKIGRFIKGWVDTYYWWLDPVTTFVTTVSAAGNFADLKKLLPSNYSSIHPFRNHIFECLVTISPIVFIISCSILVIIKVINELNRKTAKQLEHELQNQVSTNTVLAENIDQLFNGILMQLSTLLDFDNQDRITLYIHNRDSKFVPCGRFSPDPEYQKKGRPEYPDGEGCINRGWRNGWHFDSDFTQAGHKDKCTNEYGISKANYSHIGMQSLLYAVKSIKDKNSQLPIAVIVVESTDSDAFKENLLKKVLDGQEIYLAEIITKLYEHIPTLNQATVRGL